MSIELRFGELIIYTARAELVNNSWTSVSGISVPVTIGAKYTLRVTNVSSDVLGFYLNSGDTAGSIGSSGCQSHLVGEKPEPMPHNEEACLSALVRGH